MGYNLPSYLKPEVKYHDMYLTGVPVDISPGPALYGTLEWQDRAVPSFNISTPTTGTPMAAITKGTAENQRLGRKIKILEMIIDLRLTYEITSALNYNDCKDLEMYVVFDKQNNNAPAGAGANEIWETGINYMTSPKNLLRNLDEQSRFRILKKASLGRPTVSSSYMHYSTTVYHPQTIEYDKRVILYPQKEIQYELNNDELVVGGSFDGNILPGGNIQIWFVGPGEGNSKDIVYFIRQMHIRTKFIDT